MAQYWEDWSGSTIGQAPSGWTLKWNTAGVTAVVEADASGPAGRRLRLTKTTASRSALTLDAVDSDPDRTTLDVRLLCRAPNVATGTAATFFGPACRVSGTAGAETSVQGYFRQETSSRTIAQSKYVAGTATAGEAANYSWSNDAVFWLRCYVSGDYCFVAAYDTAGTLIGSKEYLTGASSVPIGAAGIFAFAAQTIDVLAVSVGTNGDPASMVPPAAAVSFSGTVANQTGAVGESFALDLSAYFVGTKTPFSYALQSGTLPAGLSLNASTGAITGTPTTEGVSSGVVVRATDQDSATADTNAFTITINAALSAPSSAPGSTSATAVSSSQIDVSWASVADAQGYDIERDGEGAPLDVGSVLAYSHTGLSAETAHSYRVRAYNSAGDGPWSSSFGSTTLAASGVLAFVHSEDSLNSHPTNSSITSPGATNPVVSVWPRKQRIIDGDGDKTTWRQCYFKLTGATGKTPTFQIRDTTSYFTGTSGIFEASWRPWYSYDNATWQRFPAATKPGSYVEFSLGAPFTEDTVYVAFQAGYPLSRTTALIAELAATYPDMIHTLPSGNGGYVVKTLAGQTDELGNSVPGQPFYAFGLWDRTSFPDDGTPKRTVLIYSGIHAGEHVGEWMLEGLLRYLCSDDAKAVALRKNFQFLIYPQVNPMGRFGGSHVRGQWSPVSPYKNANRDFYTDENAFELENSQTIRDALLVDCAGRTVVCCLDMHGQQENPAGAPPAFIFTDAAANWRNNWRTRMRAYNAAYTYMNSAATAGMRAWIAREYLVPLGHGYTPEAYEQHPCPNGVQDWMSVGEHLAKTLADTFSAAAATETPFIGRSLALDFGNAPASGPVSVSIWDGVPGHGGTLLSADKLGVDSAGKLRADASAATASTAFVLVTDEAESAGTTRSFAANVTLTTVP